ncbi:MAG: DMT family transporter [Saprospiraceae bacterium]|nr:DMT family transporter [Saprospiraceae bacterium]MCF8252366.1 DMT family transporter [Saprospiraceae bacterium]MCF8282207.1 DMT family transporter [Bacteroidales bacterium]MCF8311842.1 DMT family transporter [Saprospiraceae bacterium]MCF8442686.1 DMT family transporter [Saprospiraceae bacterium]
MSKSPGFINWLILLLLSLVWGSSFILIKKGLTGFGFVEAASIRLMAAGAVFLPFGLYHFGKIPREKWRFLVLVTFVGMFIPAFLFCLAQQHVQSAVAGILNALTPVFTFLFSIFLFKKVYRINHVAGLLLGLVCAVMLVIERTDAAFTLNIYAGLIVLATVCYGLNINLVKNYLNDVSSVALSTVSVSMGGLLAFVFIFLPNHQNYAMTEERWMPLAALVVLGIMGTALAQLFFYKLIKNTSPIFASSTTYIMPVVAVMWGLLDGEVFHLEHVLSIAGILTAVVLLRKN